MDWETVSLGKLKMPSVPHRVVSKSKLPFNFSGNDSDEEDYEHRKLDDSSINEGIQAGETL